MKAISESVIQRNILLDNGNVDGSEGAGAVNFGHGCCAIERQRCTISGEVLYLGRDAQKTWELANEI
jgi:hypothetical protein